MPFDQIKNISTASYFSVSPKIKYTVNINGKDIPQESPGIVKFNKDTESSEFVSTNFRGHLSALKIVTQKFIKTNKDFKKLEMCFESIFQGSVKKEILCIGFDRALTYTLVGKLANCHEFDNIHLNFGRYQDKHDKNKDKDYVTVQYSNKDKVKSLYITDEQYRSTPDDIILPTKMYMKENEDGSQVLTDDWNEALIGADGYRVVSTKYKKQITEIFTTCVENIDNLLTPIKSLNLANAQNIQISDEEDGEDYSEPSPISANYKVDDEDLPEIDVSTLKVQIPF